MRRFNQQMIELYGSDFLNALSLRGIHIMYSWSVNCPAVLAMRGGYVSTET